MGWSAAWNLESKGILTRAETQLRLSVNEIQDEVVPGRHSPISARPSTRISPANSPPQRDSGPQRAGQMIKLANDSGSGRHGGMT